LKYDALLDKAIKELPDVLKEHSRFEKPAVDSIIQGKTTVVKNLGDIAKAINRDVDLVSKYLIKELGTAGTHDAQHLVLKGQFREPQIQNRFDAFLEEFVLCSECTRPDTKIMREERIRRSIGSIKAPTQKEEKKELAIGDEITVEITKLGRKGDGLAKIGNYLVFVSGARVGQKVKARITGIQNTMIFAVTIEVVGSHN
jgi:translation initiation factor 2 subunit 2